jgi:hypothetical protein
MLKQVIISFLLFLIFFGLSYSQAIYTNSDSLDIPDHPLSQKDSLFIVESMRIADSIMKHFEKLPKDSNIKRTTDNANFWIYDSQGNVVGGSQMKIRPNTSIKLVDSLTNNYFILDSTHIFVTAYDKTDKLIWRTDPYKNNLIKEYRTKRPIIINYRFGKSPDYFPNKIKEGLKVIWITYNNTQFGFIDILTGKYYYCGQD